GPREIDEQPGTVLQAVGMPTGNAVGIAILTRNPANPSDPALTNAQVVKVADLPSGTSGVGALFPVIGFDKNRTAYIAWVTKGSTTASVTPASQPNAWQIWYSYATAATGWQTWSPPVQ